MARIPLEAGDDHVQRLAHENDPLRAVLELIWNSLDADADHVTVTLERNDNDGIDGVVIADDGHGIPPESIESYFRWIGNS
ncbi:MAG: ATP-binding protein [Nocardioidaceae bacterium]